MHQKDKLWAWVVTQVVECLLHEALSSNSKLQKKKKKSGWALVAHTGNPSYSGGRDQEDHGLKPAQANSS
jgi:hypothetical protein